MPFVKDLSDIRNILIVFLTPLLFLPLLICVQGKESACGYVMILMAVYWITEALPIYVTGLLPIFLFPVVGVMSAGALGSVYVNGASLMFTGSLIVAIAIEEWNIHKRIALRLLLLLGSKQAWLMLGLMITSWFLSMWISNTATTAMMLPIVSAILDHLDTGTGNTNDDETQIELEVVKDEEIRVENETEQDTLPNGICIEKKNGTKDSQNNRRIKGDRQWKNARKVFFLCIAYSANIGGCASMTGSAPNLILKGQSDLIYEKLGRKSPLTFGIWLLYGIPTTFVIVLLAWIWLLFLHRKCSIYSAFCSGQDRGEVERVRHILLAEYNKLGKLSFAQISVIGHLLLLILLWITRDFGGSYGWSHVFEKKFMNDAVPAILVGGLTFIFPSSIPQLFCRKRQGKEYKAMKPLLTWEKFNTKMPWGVILLLGGGFSIAKAAQESGLSSLIGNKLSALECLDPWLLTLVLSIIVAACTEVTSNTATTALILPILSNLAVTLKLEPIYLMMPATFSASFAFMLPVATPPNAVVFSSGHVKVLDMVKSGSLLNIIAVLVLLIMNETLGRVIF